jgi:hypothetical protein
MFFAFAESEKPAAEQQADEDAAGNVDTQRPGVLLNG